MQLHNHYEFVQIKNVIFIDRSPTGACTNLVENKLCCTKRELPSTDTQHRNFPLHLAEYMFDNCMIKENYLPDFRRTTDTEYTS